MTAWAALDDKALALGAHGWRHVQPASTVGLTDEDATAVIAILLRG